MNKDKKISYIRIAALIAVLGNAALAVVKIAVGLFSKSNALVADGIDSCADVLVAAITLVIAAILAKPADKEHPWGHRRAETVATAFLSFAIFFVGAQLVVTSLPKLFAKNSGAAPSFYALIVAVCSIFAKLLLAISQYMLGKRADSAMIKANAKNMAADAIVSVGVLAGLIISSFTNSAYADVVITVAIGAWIIKTAIGIFREANLELMDGSDMRAYGIIVEAVNCVEGAKNPHRARMRRIAGFWDISFDIHVSPKLSVLKAHDIATRVENEIKKRLENVFDIMVHIEPSGDDAVEAFGLSASEMTDC